MYRKNRFDMTKFKNMRIRFWTGFALTLSFVLGPIQSDAAPASSKPLAEKELREKLKLYQSIQKLEVAFKQTKTIKDLEVQLKSEGHLTLIRPNRVIWEIKSPAPVLVSLDEREIQIRSGRGPDSSTMTMKISDAPSDESSKSISGLVAWLNLDATKLHSQYQIYSSGGSAYRFVPKEKAGSPFEELEMTLGSGGHLKKLRIHEVSGDLLNIEFTQPKLTRAAP
jgi:outer membrane lipoprotein-sorting protein